MKKRILFVEDDEKYQKAIAAVLEDDGYQVDLAKSAMPAIELLAFNTYDLIISDLMMDSINGIEFLSYVKKTQPATKTMLLTANPTMDSELAALNIYVNKYAVKETRIDVLLKYIELLVNESEIPDFQKRSHVLRDKIEDIVIDVIGRTITKSGQKTAVPPKEFAIIVYLLERAGQAVNREEIFEAIWDTNHEAIDIRVIDVHIKDIRKKLRAQSIVSVRGFGYKWER